MNSTEATFIKRAIVSYKRKSFQQRLPQGKREEQDLSSSLLLDLAKQAEPIGEAVCAKSGWQHKGIAWTQASFLCYFLLSGLIRQLIGFFKLLVGLRIGIFMNESPDIAGFIIRFSPNGKVGKYTFCPIALQGSEIRLCRWLPMGSSCFACLLYTSHPIVFNVLGKYRWRNKTHAIHLNFRLTLLLCGD